MLHIGKLKDGTEIISLIPYAVLFSDKTFLPACPKEVVEELCPAKKETEVVLPSGVKVVKVTQYLTEDQKVKLDKLQRKGRLVILPRTVLDALNESPSERVNRFGHCVGQKSTPSTAHCKPHEKVVDVTCWMY